MAVRDQPSCDCVATQAKIGSGGLLLVGDR